jgi:predicted CoA-binding protein
LGVAERIWLWHEEKKGKEGGDVMEDRVEGVFCRIGDTHGSEAEDRLLEEVLEKYRTVAVVGLSPKEERPSYWVAKYLKENGYRIIPVNPSCAEVLGEKSYPSLLEIPPEIEVEVVDVFRRKEEVLPIAEEAIKRGAKVLWFQEGIVNEDAASRAREAGLIVVQDRCMLKEHRRLLGARS